MDHIYMYIRVIFRRSPFGPQVYIYTHAAALWRQKSDKQARVYQASIVGGAWSTFTTSNIIVRVACVWQLLLILHFGHTPSNYYTRAASLWPMLLLCCCNLHLFSFFPSEAQKGVEVRSLRTKRGILTSTSRYILYSSTYICTFVFSQLACYCVL